MIVHSRARYGVLLAVVAWTALLAPVVAGAQATPATAASSTQPADAAEPQPSLTIDEVQLQLAQVQETPDLAEDVRTTVVGLYTQAIQQLEIAQQWSARSAEFDTERQRAPEALKAIQGELAAPPAPATPDVPADATRAELEQLKRQVQSDLEAEKKTLSDWERERDRRTTRRKEIPDLTTAAKARLEALAETPPTGEGEQAVLVKTAQQTLSHARRLAVEREIEANNSELLSYDARRDLLQARIDRCTRRIGHLDKLLAAWQDVVQEQARRESEQALREAREQLKRAHPAIRPLAEKREEYALRAKEVQAENQELDDKLSATDALLAQVKQEYERVTRRVSATGLTNAIGQLLRKHRASLPSLRPLERDLRQLKKRINNAQLAGMELEDYRSELLKPGTSVGEVTARIAPGTSDDQRAMIRQAAEETVASLLGDTDSLLKEYDRLFNKLVDLDGKERELLRKIREFREYVDEKVLWIRSGTWPDTADMPHGREALAWLADPHAWRDVLTSVGGAFRANPGPMALVLVALITLWLVSPRMSHMIRAAGDRVSKPSRDNMGQTVGALIATAALAVRWPATLWFLGWVVSSPYDASDFAKAIAKGCRSAAVILFTLQTLHHIALPNGLGEKHFRWNARSLRLLRRHIRWLTAVVVPTFLVFASIDAQPTEAAKNSLGRLAFIVAFFGIALFTHRVLRPAGPILGPYLQRRPDTLTYRLRHYWYLLALALPVLLMMLAVAGYYYTAVYLGTRFIASVWIFLGLIVLRALAERWLFLQRRLRAIAEARERARQRRQQEVGEGTVTIDSEIIVIPEEKLDVAAISGQTLQLMRVVLTVVGIAALWGIWAEALPALGVLREVTVWKITQQVSEMVPTADGGNEINEYTKTIPITLANLGIACLVALLTVVAVKNIPGLLEIAVLRRLPFDAGGRFAVTAITRYTLTVVGVIVAFAQIGIGWAKVQWLVAAMTVGLGFGLQEIFANLVSGLMLLFERPIRIGDTVTVADISGVVTRIRTRATTIVGWDRKELIIPNKEFITGNVINWTLSDSILRLVLPVGIAYGSDTDRARKILAGVVGEHPNVLADPPPRILFMGFGDSTLDFEVRAYIGAVDHYLCTRDELNTAIDREFRKAGVEIAFPQRDIHVRSISSTLPIIDQRRNADAQDTP